MATENAKNGTGNGIRVFTWILAVAMVLTVLAGALVLFTVKTSFTSLQVREWVFSVGTLLGGILSASAAVLVAAIGFGSQRKQASESEKQLRLQAEEARDAQTGATRTAAKLRRIEERRRAASDLVSVIANDLAWLNEEVAPVIPTLTHQELSEQIDEYVVKLRHRYSKARGAAALVPDRDLRGAALALYDAWMEYLHAVDNNATNAISMPTGVEAGVKVADEGFFAAVDRHLGVLDDTEDALFSPMESS